MKDMTNHSIKRAPWISMVLLILGCAGDSWGGNSISSTFEAIANIFIGIGNVKEIIFIEYYEQKQGGKTRKELAISMNNRPVAEVGKKGEGIENKEEMGEE